MRRSILSIALCGILLSFSQAHEGEKHAEPEVSAVPIPGEGLETEQATSDTFELVVKHPSLQPNKSEKITLYLNDFGSNEPISEASITMQVQEVKETITATHTSVPGIYEAMLSFPMKGETVLSVNIKTKEFEDTLVVNGIKIGMTGADRNMRFWKFVHWGLVIVTIIFIVVGGFYFWKRRKP